MTDGGSLFKEILPNAGDVTKRSSMIFDIKDLRENYYKSVTILQLCSILYIMTILQYLGLSLHPFDLLYTHLRTICQIIGFCCCTMYDLTCSKKIVYKNLWEPSNFVNNTLTGKNEVLKIEYMEPETFVQKILCKLIIKMTANFT